MNAPFRCVSRIAHHAQFGAFQFNLLKLSQLLPGNEFGHLQPTRRHHLAVRWKIIGAEPKVARAEQRKPRWKAGQNRTAYSFAST